jgi:hypothetical protein
MEPSIFTDKTKIPDDYMLREALGDLHSVWIELRDYVFREYPKAMEEWNFPGQKYGWSFRIKDKKRAIIYLLPRDKYFLVAFVFGAKATSEALASAINNEIKNTIETAKVYAEGRGFRIEIRNRENIDDIKKLVGFKLQY